MSQLVCVLLRFHCATMVIVRNRPTSVNSAVISADVDSADISCISIRKKLRVLLPPQKLLFKYVFMEIAIQNHFDGFLFRSMVCL